MKKMNLVGLNQFEAINEQQVMTLFGRGNDDQEQAPSDHDDSSEYNDTSNHNDSSDHDDHSEHTDS